MLRSYLKVALRNLRKRPGYAFINIFGLAVGMACCLLILLYVRDELRYDRFHEHADRIYRIVRERRVSEGEWARHAITPWRLAPMVTSNVPQVEQAVRFTKQEVLVRYGTAQHTEPRFFMADSTFFEIFTLPLVRGDASTALHAPFSVVLTETTARKYFGTDDPVGRVITVDNRHDFTVTGVASDVPEHSHFHFDFLASLQSTETMWAGSDEMFESWGALWLYTYLLVREGTDPSALEGDIVALIEDNAPASYQPGSLRLSLQPLTSIHLHSDYSGEIETNGNATTLYLFALLAAFILLIACVNFMNLATARSAWRAREVGVRKVMGAHRGNLVQQFLGESILLSLLALVLAVLLVELALPAFNAFTGKRLALGDTGLLAIAGFGGLALLVGLVAGSYPAFYLSAFRPAAVLKGAAAVGGGHRGVRLRQGLVVLQFAITIALLVATAVVFRQLQYVQEKALGFDREHVVIVYLNHEEARERYEALKHRFAEHAGVLRVSAASNAPPDGLNTWDISWEGAPDDLEASIRVIAADEDYVETLGLDLAAGRNFSGALPTDASAFLINEAAVRHFGFDEPVGTHLRFGVGDDPIKEGPVIGVVADFHLASLHEEIRPVMINLLPSWYDQLLVRVRPGSTREVMMHLEQVWTQSVPAWPFEYGFLDERVEQQYRAEERLGRLFSTFAVLAVLIACLGLFGLASFTAERRTKEIGVRKVLGASVPGLVLLLSGDFARLVAIAFVVAAPVAYLAMHRWLDGFAYRTDMPGWIFLAAGVAALLVALFTVGYQGVRAALADPVRALRYE